MIRQALSGAGIPHPEGTLIHARYHTRTADWYVQTDRGWLWWDTRTSSWKPAPLHE